MNNKVLGSQGEQAAADYLVRQGYRICARNFRVPVGEIDIVAAKDELVVFVEVKTRRGLGCGTPAQAVTYYKQQKIIQTACWFLRQRHLEDRCLCRFDVVEVYAREAGGWKIHHIPGAFEV
jgi:putative endonuclease